MVLFSAYTIVDGIFVSKGVGELALAGVNIALPFINVLSGTAILLSMGTSTLCAFALGHGDHEKAEKIFTQTVVAIVAISAVITVAVSLFSEPLAVLLGAGPRRWATPPSTCTWSACSPSASSSPTVWRSW